MIYKSYKKIDEVGRVVLPKDIRNKIGINIGDILEMDIDEDKIIIKKAEQTCIFCGSTENLESFKGKNICKNCIKLLNNS